LEPERLEMQDAGKHKEGSSTFFMEFSLKAFGDS
jgi:hypothetical protein